MAQEENDPHDPAGSARRCASRIRRNARTNFTEVALRLHARQRRCGRPSAACCARTRRASRGCPVSIDIPAFIQRSPTSDYRGAYDVITDTNLLPAVCGRVCPQENQCEGVCTVGDTLEPVAIGRLERFVGDLAIAEGWANVPYIEPTASASASSAPAPPGMACAADMAKAGCDVDRVRGLP